MKNPKWNLAARLARLPADQNLLIRNTVMRRAGITKTTYYRFVRIEPPTLGTIQAFAAVLGCTVDQVMDPEYVFEDPRLAPDTKTPAALGMGK